MGWKPTGGGVRIEKAGTVVGTRGGINLIEGTGVTLTVADDAANDEVDVTVATTGGGGGSAPDWAGDPTDSTDAADIAWDGTVSAGLTTVTVTGSQTITEKTGILSVSFSGQGSQDYDCLLSAHTFSVGDAFAVPIRFMPDGLAAAGIIFADGTTSAANAVTAHIQHNGTEASIRTYTRYGTLTAMSSVSALYALYAQAFPWVWLRLTYQASNTFRKEVSPDGISWDTFGISDVSKTMTPTHVGVCWSKDNSSGTGIASFGNIIKQA